VADHPGRAGIGFPGAYSPPDPCLLFHRPFANLLFDGMKKGQTSRLGQQKITPFHFQFEISTTPFQNQAIKKRRFLQRNSDVLV
jgi:hypothetical protein